MLQEGINVIQRKTANLSAGQWDKVSSTEGLAESSTMTLRAAQKKVKNSLQNVHKNLSQQIENESSCNSCCYPEKSHVLVLVRLLFCLIAGIIFGFALEKGRVFEPEVIRDQMIFRRWVMMKMFLSALATGQICLSLLSILPQTKNHFQSAVESFAGCFEGKGLLSSSIGPCILGIGMTLAGACPGMVLAQVGSATRNAEYTLSGALAGALLYGVLQPLLAPLFKPSSRSKNKTIYDSYRISYARIGLVVGTFLLVTVCFLEVSIPWRGDLDLQKSSGNEDSVFHRIAWPPSIAGMLIGSLQIFIVLAVQDTLGGSSSYQTLTSQWLFTPSLRQTFSYMAKYRCGIGNWWQVVYVLGAMLGALMSSLASGTLQTTKGVPVEYAFTGGLLMLFGARLASGCTSGHGISGAALLFWLSWIAVPCMFGGAIVSALVLKQLGQLDIYD